METTHSEMELGSIIIWDSLILLIHCTFTTVYKNKERKFSFLPITCERTILQYSKRCLITCLIFHKTLHFSDVHCTTLKICLEYRSQLGWKEYLNIHEQRQNDIWIFMNRDKMTNIWMLFKYSNICCHSNSMRAAKYSMSFPVIFI